MPPFKSFDASNNDDTCLWCGARLAYTKAVQWENLTPDQIADIVTPRPTIRAAKAGPYADGFFCTMRCGYAFGVRMAQLGKRLAPKIR